MQHARPGLIALLASLVLAGCGSSLANPASGPTRAPQITPLATGLPRPAHVVVVVMENKGYDQVVGSPDAPYIEQLARIGATFTDWHAITHPSQPNYLALFSGATQGVTSDACPQTLSGPNLGQELIAAGRSFAGYSEGLPAAGFTGCEADGYARKHNPWVDFGNVPASANRPFTAFPSDPAQLPTVALVIPDLCDDMHDCSVSTGDTWLRRHLDGYVRWALAHQSLLALTWDEDEGSAGNRIATILVGQMVRPGTYAEPSTHLTLLRTIEGMYGLPRAGGTASTSPLTDTWT